MYFLWPPLFLMFVIIIAGTENWSSIVSFAETVLAMIAGYWVIKFANWWLNWQETKETLVGGKFLDLPFQRLTRYNKEWLMQVQDYKCANPYCNADLRQSTPHLDHIIPRAEGGTDSLHNVQYLCEACNLNKSDRNWFQWILDYARSLGHDPLVNRAPLMRWAAMRSRVAMGS